MWSSLNELTEAATSAMNELDQDITTQVSSRRACRRDRHVELREVPRHVGHEGLDVRDHRPFAFLDCLERLGRRGRLGGLAPDEGPDDPQADWGAAKQDRNIPVMHEHGERVETHHEELEESDDEQNKLAVAE